MNRSIFAAALLALLVPGSARAQTALFPERIELEVPADSGLVRVELPAHVVAACGPSLGDLRVIDNAGYSRPYVVDGAPPAGEQITSFALEPAEARQLTETPSQGTTRYREEYDLDLPNVAPPSGTWSIVLSTDERHFTAEVRVDRFGADGALEPLTARTVFRLPAGSEQLGIALPTGASGRIRLAISGERGFLSPTFEARSVVPAAEPTFLSLDLPIESTERADGKTILVVRRPLALVPSAIVLSTPEPTVQRYVRIFDAGADGTQAIVGEALVSRVATASGGAPPMLLVPIYGARGDRLRIEIADGDSGPLPELRVAARIHEPSVVFDASSIYRPAWIYFGGSRALPPSFPEASALLQAAREGTPPAPGLIVRIEENPVYSDEPALAFAMSPGPRLDVEGFAHEASVSVPETPEGLARIVVPAAVDARVSPSRGDLRVVDREDRQRPYIAGAEPRLEAIPLAVERTSPRPRTSRYALSLAEGPLEVRELALRVTAEYVDRPYRVYAAAPREGDEDVLLSAGRLRRRPGESDVLHVPLDTRVARVALEVDDGDDAPLAFRASAQVELPVLYVAAPAGDYRLVFGVADSVENLAPPSYELDSVRDLVLTVPAVDARVGAVEANPRFAPPSPYSASRMRELGLWAVLGLAIVVLGGLTFRLAKLAPAPGSLASPGAAPGSDPAAPPPAGGPTAADASGEEPEPPAGGPA